jgi:hypothetical protein
VPDLLRHGTSVFKVISERPVILISECRALGEEAITTYFKRLRFDAAGTSGARTHDLPNVKRGHYHLAADLQFSMKKNWDRRIESCSSSPV